MQRGKQDFIKNIHSFKYKTHKSTKITKQLKCFEANGIRNILHQKKITILKIFHNMSKNKLFSKRSSIILIFVKNKKCC